MDVDPKLKTETRFSSVVFCEQFMRECQKQKGGLSMRSGLTAAKTPTGLLHGALEKNPPSPKKPPYTLTRAELVTVSGLESVAAGSQYGCSVCVIRKSRFVALTTT